MLGKSQEFSLPTDLPQPVIGLMGFAVFTMAHGQGVEKYLLKAFEHSARLLRMRPLGLSVHPVNVSAQCDLTRGESARGPGKVMHYVRIL